MPDNDKALFSRANARADSGDYDVTDKTVSTIIADQRAYEADQQAQADAQRKLADDIRAKRDARNRQLKAALTVAFVDKGFQPADTDNGDFNSYITIELAMKNTSSKTIRSMAGLLHFQNTLGRDIDVVPMTYEHPMRAGARVDWPGTIKYNQFDNGDVALKEADFSNVRLMWEPKTILFTDGSRLDAAQNSGDNNS
jgi:hypothetical protein